MVKVFAKFAKNILCRNYYFEKIVNWIRIHGWDERAYFFNNLRNYSFDAKHPSKEMILSKEYFDRREDDIKRNILYLSDKKSIDIYEKSIKYRYTHNIKDAPIYEKDIYFCEDIIVPYLNNDEVFVDGGAFVGDTAIRFAKKNKYEYKRIISFEPDDYNYKMLSRLRLSKFSIMKKGLWNKETTLYFTNNGGCGSKIIEKGEGTDSINVCALDNVEECKDATFIKLDVEGSERYALEGAQNIIKNNKPKLAVCLYHSDADMIDLIEQVHNLNPEYKLFVRHHSRFAVETVLYAI